MEAIGIDFETFYDRGYSLSKLTTMEYILDDRFEVILVGIKYRGDTSWFSGTFEETKEYLEGFPWNNALAYAHHAMFDFGILAHRFGIHPKLMLCTHMLAMPIDAPFTKSAGLAALAKYNGLPDKGTEVVRALGKRRSDFSRRELEQYGDYCMHDVELSAQLLKKYIPLTPRNARQYIHLTLRKFTKPQLVLDVKELQAHLENTIQEKEQLMQRAGVTDRSVLRSDATFDMLLRDEGVIAPKKLSKTTGKETFAFAKTDPGMKELLVHPNHNVQILAAARVGVKTTIEEARTQRLITQGHIHDRLAVPLLYFGARTGRMTGQDKLNLLNLPKSRIRKALKAPRGYKVLALDLSQIEARILAALATEHQLVDKFREYDAGGPDPYVQFAARLYGVPIEEVTAKQRTVGKVAILGLGYGMGAKRFVDMAAGYKIHLSLTRAREVVEVYRSNHLKIVDFWDRMESCLKYMASKPEVPYQVGPLLFLDNCIVLPNATTLRYPDLAFDYDPDYDKTASPYEKLTTNWRYKLRGRDHYIYGAKLTENGTQALANVALATIEMAFASKGWYAALQVYDELVFTVPERQAADIAAEMEHFVKNITMPWLPTLPISCEVSYGDNYMEAK